MKQKTILTIGLAAICLVLLTGMAACSLVGGQSNTLSPEARINTAAAQTITARLTSPPGNATATGVPGTARPPAIVPTNTPKPGASDTPSDPGKACNEATFVRDVTMPDGSTITPNSVFTKVWEIKNSGSCAWTGSYAVVFAGQGQALGAPAANSFPANVEIKPGQAVQVAVVMRAPNEPGDYKSYWQLRSSDQKTFGVGPNGGVPFYVQVKVAEAYSFAEHLCSASWSTAAGPLPCPGKEGDANGFVLAAENPTMEDNQAYEGRGLISMPPPVPGGEIVGKFPPVMVPSDTDFRSVLSCAPNASGCYIRFKVTYRVDNGDEQVLGEWNEGFEGGVTSAIKDLDMIAGKSVAFTFYVTALAAPEQSRALWFDPRITK